MPAWTIELLSRSPSEGAPPRLDRNLALLGRALGQRGHRVRLLDTSGTPPARSPPGGPTIVRVPSTGPERAAQAGMLAVARNASDLLDPAADVIVGRDAIFGALDPPKRPTGRPVLALWLDDDTIHAFDPPRVRPADRGLVRRVGGWLDARALRRLQKEALSRARLLLVSSERHRAILSGRPGVAAGRVGLLPCGIAEPGDAGSRAEARKALKVPLDVNAVAFLGGNGDVDGLPLALDAFRRVRPLFPGSRLLVVGCPAPTEPGVMAIEDDLDLSRARPLLAADVALFPAGEGASGSGPREAMRAGVATVVSRRVPLDGVDLDRMVRSVPSDDAGDYASALAELFAVPERRREIARAGAQYAEPLTFEKVAIAFEERLAPLLG